MSFDVEFDENSEFEVRAAEKCIFGEFGAKIRGFRQFCHTKGDGCHLTWNLMKIPNLRSAQPKNASSGISVI